MNTPPTTIARLRKLCKAAADGNVYAAISLGNAIPALLDDLEAMRGLVANIVELTDYDGGDDVYCNDDPGGCLATIAHMVRRALADPQEDDS